MGLAGRVNEGNAKWWALVAACFGLFMAILDNLVVNIALPTISEELTPARPNSSGSSRPTSSSSPRSRSPPVAWATASDASGGSCLVWRLFTADLVYRGLLAERRDADRDAGDCRASARPSSCRSRSRSISNAFPPEERGKAIGIWSAISVSGLALGPIVGGALVEYASWHWIFLINVPIGIVALLVTQAVVRESTDTSGTVATDIPGTVLITGAIAALTYGLIEAGERGWGDGLILSSFVVSAILARGLHLGREPDREADDAAALLPLPHLHRRQHRRLLDLVPDRRRRSSS